MGNCRSKVIDVIPDKDVMLNVVETIVLMEEMLKKGEVPTKAQKKEMKRIGNVTREMKRLVKVQKE